MNFKRFPSPPVLKRKTAGGRVKRKGKQIYEPQPPRPLSFARADCVRVERSSLGRRPPGLCLGRARRRGLFPRRRRPCGGQDWKPPPRLPARRAPRTASARLPRLFATAESDAPSVLAQAQALPATPCGLRSFHLSAESGFFSFSLFVSSCQTSALPRRCMARCSLAGEKGSEGLKLPSGAGAPRGETQRLVLARVEVTARAEQRPDWPLPSSATGSCPAPSKPPSETKTAATRTFTALSRVLFCSGPFVVAVVFFLFLFWVFCCCCCCCFTKLCGSRIWNRYQAVVNQNPGEIPLRCGREVAISCSLCLLEGPG